MITRFAFSLPSLTRLYIVDKLALGNEPFAPKHFLKKWHINYNPEANELAKEEKYDYWWQCFGFHNPDNIQARPDTGFPVLDPWVLEKIASDGSRYFVRNPYYYKIDTAGNQLPYIDEQARILIQNIEIIQLKAIAGELSYAGVDLSLKNYPLYKKNEKKGDYHVILAEEPCGANLVYALNLTHKDPVLRKLFNDIRFRQAASLAINRDEINETLYFGKAVPRQATTDPGCSFYEDWMGDYYAEYDPVKANKLLDEMGLKWDKKHQYRLRLDGKPLAITIDYVQMQGPRGEGCELVKEYWEKIGLKVAVKECQRSFFEQRGKANEHDVANWKLDISTEFNMRTSDCMRFRPPAAPANPWYAVEWWNWYNTNGKTGEEPPELIKKLYKLTEEWLTTLPGTEKYLKLGKEILSINVKNLFLIGTVGMAPKPVIIKNNLRNTPRTQLKFIWDYRFWMPYQADQWFFKK